MTYLIIAVVVFLVICMFVGKYNELYGAQNELRKIRKQNERRR